MIYLIGGSPRCGKTTIAKKLSASWISADTIESMVASSVRKEDLARLFPKSVIRKKTKHSNDVMYDTYSTRQILQLYITQSKSSWKAIEMMVECEINEGHDYVIEGHQIHPKLMGKLVKRYGKKSVTPVVLTRFDVDEIVAGSRKHKAKNDWFVQKTKNPETFYKMAEMIRAYSEFFENESKKYGIKVMNMDGNFAGRLSQVAVYLKKV